MEIKRFLKVPKSSFWLLGPRGTGKSTLIRGGLPDAHQIDLLQSSQFLRLSQNPSLIRSDLSGFKPGSWVFIDEVQKIPMLLDEVHSLMESHKLNFALSGSSARKLRRNQANLLAGRAHSHKLFSMVYEEFKERHSLDSAILWGSLPRVITSPHDRVLFLNTYVQNYLREELMEEGILRKLEPFSRFLQVAGIYSSQILNVENVARESHISRSSCQNYFEVLEETLIGFRLPSLQIGMYKKELSHPKFYLFDVGVARACANLMDDNDVDSVWMGHSFENFILNEVKAFNSYLIKNRNLFYYKYSGGYEIDLVIENKVKTHSNKAQYTLFEIKNAKKWDKRWHEGLLDFANSNSQNTKAAFGIYRGKELLDFGKVKILPVEEFLARLARGEFF